MKPNALISRLVHPDRFGSVASFARSLKPLPKPKSSDDRLGRLEASSDRPQQGHFWLVETGCQRVGRVLTEMTELAAALRALHRD